MIAGASVLPLTMVGIPGTSATRSPPTPRTRQVDGNGLE